MNKVCKTCGCYDICIIGHVLRTAECPEWRPKWIPVSERLPTWKDGRVLIYTSYGVSIAAISNKGRWKGENAIPELITHWMPLPEPPKED